LLACHDSTVPSPGKQYKLIMPVDLDCLVPVRSPPLDRQARPADAKPLSESIENFLVRLSLVGGAGDEYPERPIRGEFHPRLRRSRGHFDLDLICLLQVVRRPILKRRPPGRLFPIDNFGAARRAIPRKSACRASPCVLFCPCPCRRQGRHRTPRK
jgi:hypothetical protein